MPKPPALFQAEDSLTQEDCGAFWKQFIAQLPPYYDETQPAFENGDLDICLPLCVSGDTEDAIRALFENLCTPESGWGNAPLALGPALPFPADFLPHCRRQKNSTPAASIRQRH